MSSVTTLSWSASALHVTANASPCQVCQARLNFSSLLFPSLPPSAPAPVRRNLSRGTSNASLPGVPHPAPHLPRSDRRRIKRRNNIWTGGSSPTDLPWHQRAAGLPLLCRAGREGQGRPTNPAGNAPSSPSLPCWNPGRVGWALPGDPRPLGSRSSLFAPSWHDTLPLRGRNIHT